MSMERDFKMMEKRLEKANLDLMEQNNHIVQLRGQKSTHEQEILRYEAQIRKLTNEMNRVLGQRNHLESQLQVFKADNYEDK